jgi:catechol 2,3-dioxygenase-like lactoylglutathione lyase family enzyme
MKEAGGREQTMVKSILGIHHITAIGGEPRQNIAFYNELLGLRLVKITVSFDDPFHLSPVLWRQQQLSRHHSHSLHVARRPPGAQW